MKSSLSSFISKEWRHILRERRTLVMLFAIPLVLVMLFGYVISTDIDRTPIAMLDRSGGDPLARKIAAALESGGQFVIVGDVESEDQITAAFRAGRVRMVVVIPEGISGDELRPEEPAQVQLITDASDLNVATTIEGYATAIIADVAARQRSEQGIEIAPPIRTQVRMIYNPELLSAYMFVPGVIALIVMIVSAMMTSVTIAREKEEGTLRMLTISPLRPHTIILGKVVPYFVLAAINTTMIMMLGVLLFEMPCKGSVATLVLLCTLFIFAAIGLGVLISALVSRQQSALTASLLGLFLPTILLSGFIFPITNMPVALQVVAQAVPATWFIQGIKALMLKGAPIQQVWLQLAVLGAMSVIFIGGALMLFARNSRPKQ